MMYVGSWARLIAFTFFSLALISCQGNFDLEKGLPTASSFNVAPTTDFPGVVMVISPDGGICTGSIVSHKAVLTAAHCTLSNGTYRVRGGFGSQKLTTVRINFGPGEVADPNDISLLVFSDNTFSEEHVIPIADSVRTGDAATLVGYGCDNLSTETGAGVKRVGTNQVARLSAYVYFYTPVTPSNYRGIIGPSNRAGSCPGDSGGPALKQVNGQYQIVAVTHAGGVMNNTIISQYVDVANRSDNRDFIRKENRDRNLGIAGF
jgi:hypothetical protein